MDSKKLLSTAVVLVVVLWLAGAAIELIATTFSIGPNVIPAAVTLGFVALTVLAAIVVGARNRRWLENPDSYW
mgnify:CR=1 FL=1